MRILLAVVLLVAGSISPSSGQARFIGVDDDPVLGDEGAKVTIIQFGDYQCPACRRFWREVEPRLKKDFIDTGKVKLVFRDFPMMEVHPEALMAAMAVNCAGDQDKYWQYHDKVFREQIRGGDDFVRFRIGDLKKWAKDSNLNTTVFDECLDSERHKDEVLKDHADGAAVGVPGTPMFFVNGRVINGAQAYPVFRKVIDEELSK